VRVGANGKNLDRPGQKFRYVFFLAAARKRFVGAVTRSLALERDEPGHAAD
jgi:hypothetical protein